MEKTTWDGGVVSVWPDSDMIKLHTRLVPLATAQPNGEGLGSRDQLESVGPICLAALAEFFGLGQVLGQVRVRRADQTVPIEFADRLDCQDFLRGMVSLVPPRYKGEAIFKQGAVQTAYVMTDKGKKKGRAYEASEKHGTPPWLVARLEAEVHYRGSERVTPQDLATAGDLSERFSRTWTPQVKLLERGRWVTGSSNKAIAQLRQQHALGLMSDRKLDSLMGSALNLGEYGTALYSNRKAGLRRQHALEDVGIVFDDLCGPDRIYDLAEPFLGAVEAFDG